MSKNLVCLFSGQGAQIVGMGKSFYENDVYARELYDHSEEILGWELKQFCFEGPEEVLKETKICQPALYVLGYAIASSLKRLGYKTIASLGLSLGELTSLAFAEVFDFETGLKIVAKRADLMNIACNQTAGGMVSLLGCSLENARILCEKYDLDVSNVNHSEQIVVSGKLSNIESLLKGSENDGSYYKRAFPLSVAGAYHSRLMSSAAEEFGKFLQPIEFKSPKFPVFSNTNGQKIEHPDDIKQALVKQVTSTVLWDDCMKNAMKLGDVHFVECGPGKILSGIAKKIDKSVQISYISTFEELKIFSQ